MATESRLQRRKIRAKHVRSKVSGTAECPRLCVRVSNKRVYGQLIDDINGVTLGSASTLAKGEGAKKTRDDASIVGRKLAEIAGEKGIKKVVFDRGGFKFHGRLAAVADAMRESGVHL